MISIYIKYLLSAIARTVNGTAKSVSATTHALGFIPGI